jgi:dimethylaniline monooxygenase (N-oxide forming)
LTSVSLAAYVFLNKSHAATTYLNRPYKRRSRFLRWLSEYHDPEHDTATEGVVEMAPWPVAFGEKGVVRWDWETCEKRGGSWKKVRERMEKRRIEPKCAFSPFLSSLADHTDPLVDSSLVLFASGYKQEFSSWLSPSYPRPWDTNIRDILSSSTPDVAFIGFVRPGVGAIPPIAEQQSMWWTAYCKGLMRLPEDEPHYYLLARPEARIRYGVDHSFVSFPLLLPLLHILDSRSRSFHGPTGPICQPSPKTSAAPLPSSSSSENTVLS